MSKFPRKIAKEFTQEITDEQAIEKYKELVEVDQEIARTSAQKASAMTDYNQQLKDLRKHQTTLLNTIETKIETRSIECEERINEARQEIEVYRLDTGSLVPEMTRPLTQEERQLDLEDVEVNSDDDFTDLEEDEEAAE